MIRRFRRMLRRLSMMGDADLLAITRYFAGELTPTEAAQLEERARTDAELSQKLRLIHQTFCQVNGGHHDEALFQYHRVEAIHAQRRTRWLIGGSALFVLLTVGATISAKASKASMVRRERAEDRASTVDFPTIAFWRKVTIDATRGDTSRGFSLMDLEVRRGSRLTYGSQARLAGGTGVMALDGEAAFHSWGTAFLIRTATSSVHMLPGRYAIRSIPHSDVTLVTVDSGLAWVESLGRDTLGGSSHEPLAVVRPGERALMRRGGFVAVFKGSKAFPTSAFNAPVGTLENDSSPEQLRSRQTYAALEGYMISVHGTGR